MPASVLPACLYPEAVPHPVNRIVAAIAEAASDRSLMCLVFGGSVAFRFGLFWFALVRMTEVASQRESS